MSRFRPLALAPLLAAVLAFAVAGCGRMAAPMSPDPVAVVAASRPATPANSTVEIVPDSQGSGDDDPGALPGLVQAVPNLVAGAQATPARYVRALSQSVKPGQETLLHTGRWTLDFHAGSLAARKTIRVALASDGSLRAKFTPDGTPFGQPVDLTVDYSGTSLDPASAGYVAGRVPALLWLDPASGRWVQMPSTYDPAARTLHAQLPHFSTWAVGSGAGS